MGGRDIQDLAGGYMCHWILSFDLSFEAVVQFCHLHQSYMWLSFGLSIKAIVKSCHLHLSCMLYFTSVVYFCHLHLSFMFVVHDGREDGTGREDFSLKSNNPTLTGGEKCKTDCQLDPKIEP